MIDAPAAASPKNQDLESGLRVYSSLQDSHLVVSELLQVLQLATEHVAVGVVGVEELEGVDGLEGVAVDAVIVIVTYFQDEF